MLQISTLTGCGIYGVYQQAMGASASSCGKLVRRLERGHHTSCSVLRMLVDGAGRPRADLRGFYCVRSDCRMSCRVRGLSNECIVERVDFRMSRLPNE
jgi:hypothetical protein